MGRGRWPGTFGPSRACLGHRVTHPLSRRRKGRGVHEYLGVLQGWAPAALRFALQSPERGQGPSRAALAPAGAPPALPTDAPPGLAPCLSPGTGVWRSCGVLLPPAVTWPCVCPRGDIHLSERQANRALSCRPKPGARNSIWLSRMAAGSQLLEPSPLPPSVRISRKGAQEQRGDSVWDPATCVLVAYLWSSNWLADLQACGRVGGTW